MEKENDPSQELERYKQLCIRSQYLLDEGIEAMMGIKDAMTKLINAIKLHKFSIEDGKDPYESNLSLWDLLDDDDINKW